MAQQNGFGPAFLYRLLRLVKGTTKANMPVWPSIFVQIAETSKGHNKS